jgi:S-adenosylmethionine synthetase
LRPGQQEETLASRTFTSESVTEGHPDKVADQISDAILDQHLALDPNSRVACETLVTGGLVVVAGEISGSGHVDVEKVVRDRVLAIGYDDPAEGFDGTTCEVRVTLVEQSADIARGVDDSEEVRTGAASGEDELDRQGAGDQGMMFGYASNETEALMPLPIHTAHRLAERLAAVRRDGTLPYLRPDGKTQVTFEYDEHGWPVALRAVLISTQHTEGLDRDSDLRPDLLEHVIRPVVPERYRNDDFDVFVNPTGRFVIGGPAADTGLTGRKIIVDTYGGMARHGGGAFSGKDPSKVDRSGAYATRWVAKNIVAAGAASRCEVAVAYAIGVARPVSVTVETFGTEHVDRVALEAAVGEVFDLRPAAIVRDLDLRRPVYLPTAAYGHFGRAGAGFTWEQTDRVDDLCNALGL